MSERLPVHSLPYCDFLSNGDIRTSSWNTLGVACKVCSYYPYVTAECRGLGEGTEVLTPRARQSSFYAPTTNGDRRESGSREKSWRYYEISMREARSQDI